MYVVDRLVSGKKNWPNQPGVIPVEFQRIECETSFAGLISECVGVSVDDITVMISPLKWYKYPLCFLYLKI